MSRAIPETFLPRLRSRIFGQGTRVKSRLFSITANRPAHQVDMLAIDAFDPLAGMRFGVGVKSRANHRPGRYAGKLLICRPILEPGRGDAWTRRNMDFMAERPARPKELTFATLTKVGRDSHPRACPTCGAGMAADVTRAIGGDIVGLCGVGEVVALPRYHYKYPRLFGYFGLVRSIVGVRVLLSHGFPPSISGSRKFPRPVGACGTGGVAVMFAIPPMSCFLC